jgi:hypothetical protein
VSRAFAWMFSGRHLPAGALLDRLTRLISTEDNPR